MTKQPKTLLLANILEHQIPSIACLEVAATELRHLHEVNQELFEALRQIIALDQTEENEWDAVERVIPSMVEIAQTAIAKAEVQA